MELYNEALELSIIGCVLENNKLFYFEHIEADSFFNPMCRSLWESINAMSDNHVDINPVSLAEWRSIRKQDPYSSFILRTHDIPFSISQYDYYVKTLKKYTALRMMLTLSERIPTIVSDYQATPDKAYDIIDEEFMKIIMNQQPKTYTMGEAAQSVLQYIDTPANGKHKDVVMTGIEDFDEATGGLFAEDLVIIGGRPSMGKSAAGLAIASSIAKQGVPVGVITMEMSARDLAMRQTSAETGVEHTRIRRRQLSQKEADAIVELSGIMAKWPLYIDDSSGQTITKIIKRAKGWKFKYDIQVLVIDQLSFIQGGKGELETYRIQSITRALKFLAKLLHITVILLAQIKRSADEKKDAERPTMDCFKGSGSIEEDADICCLLYREEYYKKDTAKKGIIEFIFDKFRGGEKGKVIELQFIAATQKITSLGRLY